MAAPSDPKRLGPPAVLPAEQLDQAAEPTPVDVAMARVIWQQYAPPKMAGLLDAAPDDGGS
jgi:hypothetical protein